jgi:hypothetical protein
MYILNPMPAPACCAAQTYRHALAVTTVRPDTQGVPYLYTLNLACRQEMWDDLRPLFEVGGGRGWVGGWVAGSLAGQTLGSRMEEVSLADLL